MGLNCVTRTLEMNLRVLSSLTRKTKRLFFHSLTRKTGRFIHIKLVAEATQRCISLCTMLYDVVRFKETHNHPDSYEDFSGFRRNVEGYNDKCPVNVPLL